MHLSVIKLKSNHEALTNLAYVNPEQCAWRTVRVKKRGVYRVCVSKEVPLDHIGLSALQRRWLQIALHERVLCEDTEGEQDAAPVLASSVTLQTISKKQHVLQYRSLVDMCGILSGHCLQLSQQFFCMYQGMHRVKLVVLAMHPPHASVFDRERTTLKFKAAANCKVEGQHWSNVPLGALRFDTFDDSVSRATSRILRGPRLLPSLLAGLEGCGRTWFACELARQLHCNDLRVAHAPDLFAYYVGQHTLVHISELLRQPPDPASIGVVLIKDIDQLKDTDLETLQRYVAKALAENVLVLASCPESLVERFSAFECVIRFELPTQVLRERILHKETRTLREKGHLGNVDLARLAMITPGYSGSNLNSLVKSTVSMALELILEANDAALQELDIVLCTEDFLERLRVEQVPPVAAQLVRDACQRAALFSYCFLKPICSTGVACMVAHEVWHSRTQHWIWVGCIQEHTESSTS